MLLPAAWGFGEAAARRWVRPHPARVRRDAATALTVRAQWTGHLPHAADPTTWLPALVEFREEWSAPVIVQVVVGSTVAALAAGAAVRVDSGDLGIWAVVSALVAVVGLGVAVGVRFWLSTRRLTARLVA